MKLDITKYEKKCDVIRKPKTTYNKDYYINKEIKEHPLPNSLIKKVFKSRIVLGTKLL